MALTSQPWIRHCTQQCQCSASHVMYQLVYQALRRKNAKRFQAKMIYVAQKRSKLLTFEYRFARKHSKHRS